MTVWQNEEDSALQIHAQRLRLWILLPRDETGLVGARRIRRSIGAGGLSFLHHVVASRCVASSVRRLVIFLNRRHKSAASRRPRTMSRTNRQRASWRRVDVRRYKSRANSR